MWIDCKGGREKPYEAVLTFQNFLWRVIECNISVRTTQLVFKKGVHSIFETYTESWDDSLIAAPVVPA